MQLSDIWGYHGISGGARPVWGGEVPGTRQPALDHRIALIRGLTRAPVMTRSGPRDRPAPALESQPTARGAVSLRRRWRYGAILPVPTRPPAASRRPIRSPPSPEPPRPPPFQP